MGWPLPGAGDLGQETPTVVQRESALDWPLTNLGVYGDDWNTERCRDDWKTERCRVRMHCSNVNCRFYHSEQERRCQAFSRGEPCPSAVGSDIRCPNGLHVSLAELCRIFEIDLDRGDDAMARAQELEGESADERAKIVRMIVYGFASFRGKLLKKCLQPCPTVHDIILPDRAHDSYTCVFFSQLHEECSKFTPRFRNAVFGDNQAEPVWH